MIEKMKFLSITGPRSDIDRVVHQYLSKYEIHLENAMAQLGHLRNISPYIEINPYREALARMRDYEGMIGNGQVIPPEKITLEECQNLIGRLNQKLTELRVREESLHERKKEIEADMKELKPFLSLPCDLSALLKLKFVQCRFGRVPKQNYANFEHYVYEHLETVFYLCSQDADYVWGVYFVPKPQFQKVNAVFASMHFERVYIHDKFTGTPAQAYNVRVKQLQEVQSELQQVKNEMAALIQKDAVKIVSARAKLESMTELFDVRKAAGCIREQKDEYYILCGWMTEKDAGNLEKDVENDPNLFCIIEDDQNQIKCKPPTKLTNPKIIRPFEMYVKMYGLPGYHELDPTWFVAMSYAFIFGAMFGDVGQGLCLTIGGFLLYHIKKMDLAAIIGTAGIFSTIFGFLFGSVFGFEDILPALWLHPVSAMMNVPLLGKMNTVFVVAIAFGMCLNLTVMLLHIMTGWRNRDSGETWLDANAAAGFWFYGTAFVCIILLLLGKALPAGVVLAICFGCPVILIGLKEPIVHRLEGKPAFGEGKVMYFVQTFFELFEIMLSYFSNTLSFVRIGAFAVSHAAMMEVVMMLAGAESGSPNILIIVLGNIFVCAMEGLIVGIQVLRLEYYELFSRFYKGDGKPFVPFSVKSK